MSVENGEWIMKGLAWDDPYRIRSPKELVSWINEVGFLPLFGNGMEISAVLPASIESGSPLASIAGFPYGAEISIVPVLVFFSFPNIAHAS